MGKFVQLLLASLLINPISVGVMVGLLSVSFPDIGSVRWNAPKSGPVYFDEMFKAGFCITLLSLIYLLYRYRKILGEQAVLFVCLVQLLILIIVATIRIRELQYVLDELSSYPNQFQNVDQLWVKIGWAGICFMTGVALFVTGKIVYNHFGKA